MLYEQIADKLQAVMEKKMRFDDFEKAQLFIGYLANFPKKEKLAEPDTASIEINKGEN